MRAFLAVALLLGAAFALPAKAFLSDSEARKQVADLRTETQARLAETAQLVEALRQRLEATGKNQFEFSGQTETLRADIARLTGQIELLTHSLETAHKRQQDFYVDLDSRLRKLETAPASPSPDRPADPQPDQQQEMRDYEAALGLFRERKFAEAQAAFAAFLDAHPRSALRPNAQYWLGSSHYHQNGFLQAARAFGKVAADWPDDPRAPEALLQQADALVKARDVPAAIKVLTALAERYPAAPEAGTARSRLKTLAPQRKR